MVDNKSKKQPRDPLELHRRWALATGFPFENDVVDILREVKHKGSTITLERGYSFQVVNEDKQAVIRSVDFRLSVHYNCAASPFGSSNDLVKLTFVIEAKFSDTHKWWFFPSHDGEFLDLQVPALVPKVKNGDNIELRVEFLNIGRVPACWKFAESGRKIKLEKSDINEREEITNMQIQILQGTMSSLIGSVYNLEKPGYGPRFDAEFFYPIVVTNAELNLLRPRLSVQSVRDAEAESDLYTVEPVIALERPRNASLIDYMEYAEGELGSNWHSPSFRLTPTLFVSVENLMPMLEMMIKDFEERTKIA